MHISSSAICRLSAGVRISPETGRAAEPLSLTFTMCGTNVASTKNWFAQAAAKPRLQTR
jgi:hypothetical protein